MKLSTIYKENSYIHEFINSLPLIFDREGTILYAERNVIKRFMFNGQPIIVKRFRIPSFLQRIIYSFFRKSKAERAFRNGIILQERGIDTPRSIAYSEEYKNKLFKYGYYITECNSNPPIRECLHDLEEFDKNLANAFAIFVADLHQKGILHHDLNSTNVLYQHTDESYSFSLIDINRMSFLPKGKLPSRKACLNNLTRFTGRMDVFCYVLKKYAICRGWDIEATIHEAVNIKETHDKHYRQRKAFFKIFKKKNQNI